MWKILIFFGLLGICRISEAFTISASPGEVTVTAGSDTSFYFRVRPWPPPCCKVNSTEWDKYLDVKVKFYNNTADDAQLICDVQYERGDWVDTSGKCSLLHDRVADFYPDNNEYLSFQIQNSTLWDMGSYSIQIIYDEFQESSQASLIVHASPTQPILTLEPDGELSVGDDVNMTCSVTGANPPARIQWSRDYTDFSPDPQEYFIAEDWKGSTSWRFKYGPVAVRDHGITFTCTAFNDVSTVSKGVPLIVRHIPSIQLKPCVQQDMKYHVIEDSAARFTCAVSAWPDYDNSSLIWKEDGVTIEPSLDDQTHVIDHVTKDLNGHNYACEATNEIGTGAAACQLDVQYGAIITSPDKLEIRETEPLKITCHYDANPQPYEVFWSKDSDANFRVEGAEYHVESVEPVHEGTYKCNVHSTLRPTDGAPRNWYAEKSTSVHIKYAAKWTLFALEKFVGEISKASQIVCDTMAYPAPQFTWRRLGQEVVNGPRIAINTEGSKSTLRISSLVEGDFGDYECLVQNEEGERTFQLLLLKPDKPDPPQQCDTDSATARGATLKCMPGYDGGSDITYHVIDEATKKKKVPTATLR